jgi:polyisoprenoid-binding protein YceI
MTNSGCSIDASEMADYRHQSVGAGTKSRIRLRRGVAVGAIAGAGLLVLGGASWLLLSSHHAPAPLALSKPAAGSSQSSLVGTWKVATGSEAGYRVKEKFINQPATTEAVARTPKIAGGLAVTSAGSELVATKIHFTADLTALVSQDRYANYQVFQRDMFVRNIYLETNRFPTADFTATSVRLPADVTGSTPLSIDGKLKVHGFTKPEVAQVQVQVSGNEVEIAGSINVDMRDFAIAPPDISFTTAEPQAVIEFHLLLERAG